MLGVIIGDKHTYRDYGLLLKSRPEISAPAPKTKLIPVPGSDVVIDLTESLTGSVHFEPREIKLELIMAQDRNRWAQLYTRIMTDMHGRRLKIVMDDDPNYYYIGRVSVEGLEPDKKTATLTIKAEVEPYKRERFGDGRAL